MDTMNLLENDIMQAKYIEIVADGKIYTCNSDINLLKYGDAENTANNLATIDKLIDQTKDETNALYATFKNDTTVSSDPKYDTVGDKKRAEFDAFYNKVKFMTIQDKLVYEKYLDSLDYEHNSTLLKSFDSLSSGTTLSNISQIVVVYPIEMDSELTTEINFYGKPVASTSPDPSITPDPSATPSAAPSPSVVSHTEKIYNKCCVATFTVNGNELEISRDFYTLSGPGGSEPLETYTDIVSGNLSGSVDSSGNAVSLNLKFMDNNRQYNSKKTIVIRNSNVLNDAN